MLIELCDWAVKSKNFSIKNLQRIVQNILCTFLLPRCFFMRLCVVLDAESKWLAGWPASE